MDQTSTRYITGPLTESTLTESAFNVPAQTRWMPPVNLSAPIRCTLAGYEALSVRYVVSRSKAQIKAAGAQPGEAPLMALLVHDFPDWPSETAAPVGNDPASFDECDVLGQDLIAWLLKTGYRKAIEAAISPN